MAYSSKQVTSQKVKSQNPFVVLYESDDDSSSNSSCDDDDSKSVDSIYSSDSDQSNTSEFSDVSDVSEYNAYNLKNIYNFRKYLKKRFHPKTEGEHELWNYLYNDISPMAYNDPVWQLSIFSGSIYFNHKFGFNYVELREDEIHTDWELCNVHDQHSKLSTKVIKPLIKWFSGMPHNNYPLRYRPIEHNHPYIDESYDRYEMSKKECRDEMVGDLYVRRDWNPKLTIEQEYDGYNPFEHLYTSCYSEEHLRYEMSKVPRYCEITVFGPRICITSINYDKHRCIYNRGDISEVDVILAHSSQRYCADGKSLRGLKNGWNCCNYFFVGRDVDCKVKGRSIHIWSKESGEEVLWFMPTCEFALETEKLVRTMWSIELPDNILDDPPFDPIKDFIHGNIDLSDIKYVPFPEDKKWTLALSTWAVQNNVQDGVSKREEEQSSELNCLRYMDKAGMAEVVTLLGNA